MDESEDFKRKYQKAVELIIQNYEAEEAAGNGDYFIDSIAQELAGEKEYSLLDVDSTVSGHKLFDVLEIDFTLKRFLDLTSDKSKLEKEYAKLTGKEKENLYGYATLDNCNNIDSRYAELRKFIEEQSANDNDDEMESYIKIIKFHNDFINEASASGRLLGMDQKITFENIYAEINGLLQIIEVYKKINDRKQSNKCETNEFAYNSYSSFKQGVVLFPYIFERIQRLKLQLKSEPLEELRFLLINFQKLYKTDSNFEHHRGAERHSRVFNFIEYLNEVKVYVVFMHRHMDVLDKSVYELSEKLTVIKREIEKDESFGKKIHLSSDKLKKIIQKVKNEKDFESVHKNYYVFRDVYSLEKIMDYIDVVKSVDLKEDGIMGKLIIQRALQAIGELLKNSESSPYLSEKTRNYLKKCNVPVKELEELRDKLSHDFTLCKRINIEDTDDDIFKIIKDEIEALENIFDKVLDIIKCERTLWQLDEAMQCINSTPKKTNTLLTITKNIVERKHVISDYIDTQCKTLFTRDQYVDQYNGAIKVFSDKINEKIPDCKLSDGFKRRLETLLNILDSNYVRRGLAKMFLHYDESWKPLNDQNAKLLWLFLENDRKLLTAILMLFLDLLTSLTDMKLFLKDLVQQDVQLYLTSWNNSSTRNHIGHEDALLSSVYSNAMLLIMPIIFFNKHKQEIISLVSLLDDYEIKKIIFKEINRKNFNEKWLNQCHEKETQCIINKHKDSIKTILNSTDYYQQLSDLAKLENIFFCIKEGTEKKVIELLNKNTDLDVNQEDEDGRTLLYYALSKKLYNVINILLCKKANLYDQHISIIKENKLVHDYVIKKTIQNNDIEHFKIFDGLILKPDSTHLNLATLSNSVEIMKYLLSKGLDPNIPDREGNLPLGSAVHNANLATVSLLLKNGAQFVKAKEYNFIELARNNLGEYERKYTIEKKETKREKLKDAISNLKAIYDLLRGTAFISFYIWDDVIDKVKSALEGKDNDTLSAMLHAKNFNSQTLLEIAVSWKRNDIATFLQDKLRTIQALS